MFSLPFVGFQLDSKKLKRKWNGTEGRQDFVESYIESYQFKSFELLSDRGLKSIWLWLWLCWWFEGKYLVPNFLEHSWIILSEPNSINTKFSSDLTDF